MDGCDDYVGDACVVCYEREEGDDLIVVIWGVVRLVVKYYSWAFGDWQEVARGCWWHSWGMGEVGRGRKVPASAEI